MTTKVLHIRLDENIKNEASDTLAAMGLTISEAVRVFLTQVVAQKQIPFVIKSPNAETLDAMQEANDISRAQQTRFSSSEQLVTALEQNS
ncbi:MAG: type II toxin-antitoxin system RelB/DinJ family antitoxin [Thiomicrospira sp.]